MDSQQTLFKTKKKQINIYDDNAIYDNGVSGDIAGVLISKLNKRELIDIQGNKNSILKNFLGINEYSKDEKTDNEINSINFVDRIGNNYVINGNTTLEEDKSKVISNLNVSIIDFYIRKKIFYYSDNLLSSTLSNSELETRFRSELDKIIKEVSKYMKNFSYKLTLNSKTIDVEIYLGYEKLISKITVKVNKI